MSEYFNNLEVCPHSKELLLYNTVTTVRYGLCGLLNPNYIDTKVLERSKTSSITSQEIIEIDESPIAPAKRRGLATQIPTIPSFKLGNSEKERQMVDQKIADQRSKSGFSSHIPIVHFNVGIAHFHHDNALEDG